MAKAEAWVMIPKLDEDKTGCVLDMRPLVLCKDCKHHFDGEHTDKCCEVLMEKAKWQIEIVTDDDWFCADGRKR